MDTSSCCDHYHGNSILIQETKNRYVSVGWYVSRFETDDEITDYISPVGNSDVPYPVAYSNKFVFFMLDNVYVKKEQLQTPALPINAENIYGEFYGHDVLPKKQKNQNKINKIKMKKFKILIKRKN